MEITYQNQFKDF